MEDFTDFKAPFYPYEHIKEVAKNFLESYNSDGEIPVDIELIVERDMGINIIPIPLELQFGVSALTSIKRREIRVDIDTCNENENRFRFSLAHEVGHIVLHQDIFESVNYNSYEDFKNLHDQMPANEYGWLERHADDFAGLILVPTDELHNQLRIAVQKLVIEGFTITDENHEIILGYISTSLGKHFNVSDIVPKIRINKEGIDLREYL